MQRLIISSILIFKFEPVTPVTNGTGDFRYSSQTFNIPSPYASGSIPLRSTDSSQALSRASINRAPIHHTKG